MALKPVTVSELNRYLSRIIETDPILSMAAVRGEISAPRRSASGHLYFTLKDESSRISCMIPADELAEMHLEPADGMEVTVRGRVHVYMRGGSYTLIVKSMEAEGEGSLQIAFQKLKEKLEKEGLFDPAHKKPIPPFPSAVGVITSGTGAAVRDILKNLTMRNDFADILVFPVLVQGDQAASDIASAIRYANRVHPELDVLIVGRGGGSIEDLWAFNEEAVARAVYDSEIPVISAVGHEIDFTISDMTADLRAETPTKGAVLAVPDTHLLKEELEKTKQVLSWRAGEKLQNAGLAASEQRSRLMLGIRNRLQNAEHELKQLNILLKANHPERILQQGYSMLEDQDGRVISDISQLQISGSGQDHPAVYHLIMKNGRAEITVVSKEDRKSESAGRSR
ncbi:MAG: exodeoxyribonuclease VII large subunit [Eubacterium sp.]|jgi:exodeoxyribonuclease VII large subunit|nr:exodeoxyribonuclease VII large subunit [Eubacterium sp.]MCH4047662.1 exodeoxyribonuclease VII large subunit [Eubacterium sp.]MCH4078434.1 exodeoxyribonuclease VII large subunit [Eubacterium sp.]MCH4109578.1 exodeoxyribonuclease VII large subunit [Eubacterium sp.]MCI1306674.1 exodeoxyribonuclease VII large subunit [Eubacterium sp.]